MTTTSSSSSTATAPPCPNHQLFSTAPRWPSSRRSNNYNPSISSTPSSPNSSFRSSSSASSSFASPPPTPSSATTKQVGIPFSWEDLPGIPKTRKPEPRHTNSKSSKTTHLPLPPAGPKDGRRNRESSGEGGRRDPFMAALLECSRDSGGDGQGRVWKKVGRSVSERFSMTTSPISIYQFSCKRSCSVSDAVVFLPRSRRLSYDVINKTTG